MKAIVIFIQDVANYIRQHQYTQNLVSFAELGVNHVITWTLNMLDRLTFHITGIAENTRFSTLKSWLNTGVSKVNRVNFSLFKNP